jgi:hypothetical protein
MSRIRDQLTSRENLQWAWAKAKRMYDTADGPVDWGSVAAFELDLEGQLRSIGRDFDRGRYRLEPLILLPQPKKPDEDGTPRLRQSFHVGVRDQVAWIALVNVIGPLLDSQMPAWVYGHRLYKAAWFEEFDDGDTRLALGPYRHSTGALYRKFKHSWPLFRRHVSLSARTMVSGFDSDVELDAAEQAALTYEDRPAYLSPDWWAPVAQSALHYVSIDLKRFYPTVKQSAIISSLRAYLPDYQEDEWLQSLVERMLRFEVNAAGSGLLGDEVVQPVTNPGRFRGIPTGLMVAGFLSNVAMLRLDREVEDQLQANRRIAHLRFVDDHAILAYDFDELCTWIQWYEDRLARLAIGPRISPTKFDPPNMAKAYRAGAKAEARASARALSKIDGRHPSHLMTKTLALVSELAGADFDILSATSKRERLSELEWLLVADLPDREIRADTRAAFAAGRISTLVPVATTPSLELLTGFRELAQLDAEIAALEARGGQRDIAELRARRETMFEVVKNYRHTEADNYRKRLAHYFELMRQALQDHPEKPRLFLRLLDYCRTTGHPGTGSILKWLSSAEEGPSKCLANYLRPLAIQTIARHVATAVHDLNDPHLLERQRVAARQYLTSLTRREMINDLRAGIGQAESADVAATFAASTLRAALAWAAEMAAAVRAPPRLPGRLARLLREVRAPALAAPSGIWEEQTGYPLGVWAHWLENRGQRYALEPSEVWHRAAPGMDSGVKADLQNLRKGLSGMPTASRVRISSPGPEPGQLSDSGLVLDHLRSGQFVELDGELDGDLSPSEARVRDHFREVARSKDRVTLDDWVRSLIDADRHDPRRSEWTALEILRQLVAPIGMIGGPEASVLDNLHPSNVLVPRRWMQLPKSGYPDAWTWEAWRREARRSTGVVRIGRRRIVDYRRQPTRPRNLSDDTTMWRARLHGCGLLLLGLVSQDFRLPAFWNVRGLEGDIAGFVRFRLEQVPVSSLTHGIIEAALLPRSVETAFIRTSPWAFFGARVVTEINDTRSDPPFIADPDDLLREIGRAQETLEHRQISVLQHAPRQLIPMNVSQLSGMTIDVVEPDLLP